MTTGIDPRSAPLLSLLAERLDVRPRLLAGHPSFNVYSLDLSRYLYVSGMDNLLYVQPSPDLIDDQDIYYAYRELLGTSNWRRRIKLLFLDTISNSLASRLRELESTVIMTRSDLDALMRHKTVTSPLREAFRQQLDVDILIPYQYKGAVTGNRFFGRDVQVNNILRHPEKSYLVTGTRMSGKTSLLLEAKRRISDQYSDRTAADVPEAIYVDCKRSSTIAGVINNVLTEMGDRTSFSNMEKWKSPQRWPALLTFLRAQVRHIPSRRLHILLDEYDSVVNIERREKQDITWEFRSLQQDNSTEHVVIQFVIAGSKTLAGLTRDNESAFYNFLDDEGCRLANFDLGTVRKVLQQPMEDLGFALDDAALISQELMHETAGRPASVQYICIRLLHQLKAVKRQVISVAVIRQVVQSPDYLHYYEGTLHENTDDLQKFILCAQSKEPKSTTFSQEDIISTLKDLRLYVDSARLFRSLEDLVNSGFITFGSGGELRYEIAVPVIKRIYRGFPLDSYVPILVAQGVAGQF